MTAVGDRLALVLVPPVGDPRWVTGLGLAERARRVAVLAGVAADRVVLVRSLAELEAAAPRLAKAPLVVVRATDQLVAVQLLQPLRLTEPGTRYAIDPARGGAEAGAWVVDAERAEAVLAALRADLAAGETTLRATWADAEAIEVGPRARFPVPTKADQPAASRWQYELVDKPLDSFLCRRFYRPLARPLTKLFLRSPLTPNVISVISIILSLAGCIIAMGASWSIHVIGMALLVVGGIVDANDGEVARLRLEMSKAGAWLDAMGDDMARLALIVGIGGHVAHLHPSWSVWSITAAALAMTVVSLLLIYWYCIFVIHSTNNQDYTKALEIGPGNRPDAPRTVVDVVIDWAAQIVRRDFIDLGVLATALFAVSEIAFVGLAVGALVTLIVVIPTHLKIVKSLRAERAAART